MGKFLIVMGAILVISGIILNYFGKISWLGKLPGDIRVEKENFKFYFPITTSILISILLTFILYIVNKLRF